MIEPDGRVVSYAELARRGGPLRPRPAGARPERRGHGRDAAAQRRRPRSRCTSRRSRPACTSCRSTGTRSRPRSPTSSATARPRAFVAARAVRRDRGQRAAGPGRDQAPVRGGRRARLRAAGRARRRRPDGPPGRRARTARRCCTRRAPPAGPRACAARSPAPTRTTRRRTAAWFFGLFGLAPFDDHVHLCGSPLYHTAVLNFAADLDPARPHRGADGPLGPGGGAAADRAAPGDAHATRCRPSSAGCSRCPKRCAPGTTPARCAR